MGPKGLVLRPRCIGSGRTGTQIPFYSTSFYGRFMTTHRSPLQGLWSAITMVEILGLLYSWRLDSLSRKVGRWLPIYAAWRPKTTQNTYEIKRARPDNTRWYVRQSLSLEVLTVIRFVMGIECQQVMWCDVMWCDVMWCDAMWCDVMWCEVKWVTVKALGIKMPCTLWWLYGEDTWLYGDCFIWCVSCTVVVLFCNVCVCVYVCGFCNVWVCVCVGFVMCGCVYVWVL